MRNLLIYVLLMSSWTNAQELPIKGESRGGIFSLGMRTTLSTFNGHHNESNGLGMGGQFRVQFADRVNSDWFFDYIRSDIDDYATRTDYHIGWSVLFYPFQYENTFFQPYILAGHCFDKTDMFENGNRSNNITRWSSAAQAGLGMHFNLTERLDISLVGQYMIHLGNEVEAHKHGNAVMFHEKSGSSMEGHLLFHIGINYKIADLW